MFSKMEKPYSSYNSRGARVYWNCFAFIQIKKLHGKKCLILKFNKIWTDEYKLIFDVILLQLMWIEIKRKKNHTHFENKIYEHSQMKYYHVLSVYHTKLSCYLIDKHEKVTDKVETRQ